MTPQQKRKRDKERRQARIGVGDIVSISTDYAWSDHLLHYIVRETPDVGGVNFGCTQHVSHVRVTLVRSRKKAPTCLQCAIATVRR